MLKKIVAILFITVYLFNLAGYTVLFDYFIHQADKHTVQELDKGNYNEAELFEIKIPLNLPYYNSWDDYERFDGEIELNGVHYNFVKRKVLNDTLFLLCLPNYAKTELNKAKNEFAAKENNNESSPSSKKGMETSGKKNSIETECNQLNLHNTFLRINSVTWKDYVFSSELISCFISSLAKPPEIAG